MYFIKQLLLLFNYVILDENFDLSYIIHFFIKYACFLTLNWKRKACIVFTCNVTSENFSCIRFVRFWNAKFFWWKKNDSRNRFV